MKNSKTNMPTEEELSLMSEEERNSYKMLNTLETILMISIELKNQKYAEVLEKEIDLITKILFGESENLTNEETEKSIKLSIKGIEDVAVLLEECGDIKNANTLAEMANNLSELIFGLDFAKEWNETFEKCYKIAMENGDMELADEIKKYIGIPRDQELDENFTVILNRCIAMLSIH